MSGAIDAFAGAGGLSLGLQRSGWEILFAFDNDPIAVDTYNSNLGHKASLLDAHLLTPPQLMSAAGIGVGQCGLLAGGPPCQGFSLQGRGSRDDPRNALVLSFVQLILGIEPRAFLMENVPAIGTKRGRQLIDTLIEETGQLGYRVYVATLDAADYGVAQHRRRTFVVGLHQGAGVFRWPAEVTAGKPQSVRQALAGLPSPPTDGSPHSTIPNHYREAKLSPKNIERIRHVPPGGGREFLPPELQLACHANGHRHFDTYGRLAWDEPAVTLTSRFDSFTRGRFGHPVEDRSITLREGARLQGFPDDYRFLGSREDGARLIGNAVPPPLAQALGQAIKLALSKEPNSQAMAAEGTPAAPATVQVPLGL